MRRLLVFDYHLASATLPRVPSREADALMVHVHGWLYRICHEERRPTDDQRHESPFGAWMLASDRRTARDGCLTIRVCWYDEEYGHRATATLAREQSAVLGGLPVAVEAISPVVREPVTAAMLYDQAPDDPNDIELFAITPVVFRRNHLTHITLDPIEVLRACEDRWHRIWPGTLPYAPPTADDPSLQALREGAYKRWHRIPVNWLETKTVTRKIGDWNERGITGRVQYCLGRVCSREMMRMAVALLRGAEIFGLGARVAYGFGGINVVTRCA